MRAVILAAAMGLWCPFATSQALAATHETQKPLSPAVQPAFTTPQGWTLAEGSAFARLRPPEGNFDIAIVSVGPARDAADALARAWTMFRPTAVPVHGQVTPSAAENGWDERQDVQYPREPAAQAVTRAQALRSGKNWTVVIFDGAVATLAKRGSAVAEFMQTLSAPGFHPESFVGRTARPLDASAVKRLLDFIRGAMSDLDIPGVGVAMLDHDRIVFEGGLGVRDLTTREPVDARTRFMIASNTKGMTTLLMARLVDEGKLRWDQTVTSIYPEFRLGDPDVTRKVLVRHLICACTGLPRQDFEWGVTGAYDSPATDVFRYLSTDKPTSGFGEVYQYSNLMATAAGFIAGHVAYPDLEIGEAYNRAMQAEVFDRLGMSQTTFDSRAAQSGDHATGYAEGYSGALARVRADANDAVHAYRPTGGAWSTPHDMALYVRNELTEGRLPDGRRLYSRENLLKRREPNVKVGAYGVYGMGIMVDQVSGVTVVHHGGSLPGYMSDWYAIPAAGVGFVLLTNADSGVDLLRPLERRLVEVLYGGRPEAQAQVIAAAAKRRASFAGVRQETSIADIDEIQKRLAPAYSSPLAPLRIVRDADGLAFDLNGKPFHVAWRRTETGDLSFVTVEPGLSGLIFLAGERNGRKVIVYNDGQNEYVFTADAG